VTAGSFSWAKAEMITARAFPRRSGTSGEGFLDKCLSLAATGFFCRAFNGYR
jgi:hypothetical protein